MAKDEETLTWIANGGNPWFRDLGAWKKKKKKKKGFVWIGQPQSAYVALSYLFSPARETIASGLGFRNNSAIFFIGILGRFSLNALTNYRELIGVHCFLSAKKRLPSCDI